MSMIPTSGIVNSAAGAPLSQTAGSETEKLQKDSSAASRREVNDKKADESAGIGQTEQDEGTSERDADGRRFWEANDEAKKQSEESDIPSRQSKDPAGLSGNSLDLTG